MISTTARCGCSPSENRLCSTATRLKNRLAAERELAASNGDWSHHAAVLLEAERHVGAIAARLGGPR